MPRLTVRLTAEDLALLRAAAAVCRVTPSELLRGGVRRVARAVLSGALDRPRPGSPEASDAAPPADRELEAGDELDRRGNGDRRRPRERYEDEDLERWAVHLAEHGERRGPWWRERREARP